MKKLSCVKLHETWCLYFPFLFSSSVMQSFFSFPASSLFGTQQQLTHRTLMSLILPIRKTPVFQGVAPRHRIFTSPCVIPLWDSATAHALPVKEFNPSSQEDTVFQGVAPWHTIFTSCCFIPLWGLTAAHSPSGKELKLSSLEESCFSGLIGLLMFSYYPTWAPFGLVRTHITH